MDELVDLATEPLNALEPEPEPHEIQFRAVDEVSGKPIAGLRYSIEVVNGASYTGETDAEGLTRLITTSGPRDVELVWLAADDDDDDDDDDDFEDGDWC